MILTDDESKVLLNIPNNLINLDPAHLKVDMDESLLFSICRSLENKGLVSIKLMVTYENGKKQFGIKRV